MATDSEETVISIPGLLRNKIYKKLIFRKEGLTIEKPLSFGLSVFIPAEDIISFRYGVNWLRGYKFVFGRQYIIQVQDLNNKITSIKLNSVYQIRSKTYGEIWSDVFTQLWHYYFINTYNHYFNLYNLKREFELSALKFYPFGVIWDNNTLFWNEIALSNYQTYFVIHHKDDLKKTQSRNFKNDWNAYMLQRLLKKIIEEHNSSREANR